MRELWHIRDATGDMQEVGDSVTGSLPQASGAGFQQKVLQRLRVRGDHCTAALSMYLYIVLIVSSTHTQCV